LPIEANIRIPGGKFASGYFNSPGTRRSLVTNPLRFGLIGYGLFRSHHARAIEKNAGACLAAIAVPSEQSRAAVAQAHPAAMIFADYHELLHHPEIDVVSVVVPN
jgi:predicted dehydrogenase